MMAIKDDVAALLLSPEVQKIRFVAESVRIGGDSYKGVAAKITSGGLTVVVNPALATAGADASYFAQTNRIELPTNTLATTYDRQVVVHELTHAAIDSMNLSASRGLHATEDEGIAYIAEHLYVRYVHGPRVNHASPRFYRIADAIARNIIGAGHAIYVLTKDEIRHLRNAIGQHSIYHPTRGQLTDSDGI